MTARLLLLVVAGVFASAALASAAVLPREVPATRQIEIHYVAHDGVTRAAYVLLPAWYAPGKDPPLPLVISPHGRGVDARANAHIWGDLPGRKGFAVVNPEGQGRKLELYSWGDPGQVADLARMPEIVQSALPWVHVDRSRIYAVGGSMGGQETLLLVARYPHLLAGAISFDAPTNLALRYRDFPGIAGGGRLQQLASFEVGGTPLRAPRAWAMRSPLEFARGIAFSGVPLELWWSRSDRIVVDQAQQSGLLYREIRRLNSAAPVIAHVGTWVHCAEMRWTNRLPQALEGIGIG
ncbi:MAG: alpha/beta hydrolase family protein [Gaiellaceae bacterium]